MSHNALTSAMTPAVAPSLTQGGRETPPDCGERAPTGFCFPYGLPPR